MIQVQEPQQNQDPFNMDLGSMDDGMDMGLELPTIDIGLNF